MEKQKEPLKIYDYVTCTGKANVESSEKWKFSYQMQDFAEHYHLIHNNIKQASKMFVDQSEEISKTVNLIGKNFELLGDMYK